MQYLLIVIVILLVAMAVYYLYATMRENKVKEAQKAVSEGNLDTAFEYIYGFASTRSEQYRYALASGEHQRRKGKYPGSDRLLQSDTPAGCEIESVYGFRNLPGGWECSTARLNAIRMLSTI